MAYYYDSVTTTDKTIDDDVNEVKTVCFSPLYMHIYYLNYLIVTVVLVILKEHEVL